MEIKINQNLDQPQQVMLMGKIGSFMLDGAVTSSIQAVDLGTPDFDIVGSLHEIQVMRLAHNQLDQMMARVERGK